MTVLPFIGTSEDWKDRLAGISAKAESYLWGGVAQGQAGVHQLKRSFAEKAPGILVDNNVFFFTVMMVSTRTSIFHWMSVLQIHKNPSGHGLLALSYSPLAAVWTRQSPEFNAGLSYLVIVYFYELNRNLIIAAFGWKKESNISRWK